MRWFKVWRTDAHCHLCTAQLLYQEHSASFAKNYLWPLLIKNANTLQGVFISEAMGDHILFCIVLSLTGTNIMCIDMMLFETICSVSGFAGFFWRRFFPSTTVLFISFQTFTIDWMKICPTSALLDFFNTGVFKYVVLWGTFATFWTTPAYYKLHSEM